MSFNLSRSCFRGAAVTLAAVSGAGLNVIVGASGASAATGSHITVGDPAPTTEAGVHNDYQALSYAIAHTKTTSGLKDIAAGMDVKYPSDIALVPVGCQAGHPVGSVWAINLSNSTVTWKATVDGAEAGSVSARPLEQGMGTLVYPPLTNATHKFAFTDTATQTVTESASYVTKCAVNPPVGPSTNPGKTNPGTAPVKPNPGKVTPSAPAKPVKTAPVKTAPVKAAPVKTTPVMAAPVKPAPAKPVAMAPVVHAQPVAASAKATVVTKPAMVKQTTLKAGSGDGPKVQTDGATFASASTTAPVGGRLAVAGLCLAVGGLGMRLMRRALRG